jgi:large subunit ribosomal protein L10
VTRAVFLAGLPDIRTSDFFTVFSMALTRDQKAAQLTELKDKIQKAKSVMFSHYIGLSVADITDLRSKLRAQKAEMKVGKKTLIRIAAKELNLPEVTEESMPGAVACIFSFDDPIAGAQVTHAFAKTHDHVKLIGGIFDGKILTAADAKTFALLPSRQVLLGTFAGMIQSPLRSFASICASPLSGFARALNELAKKKEATPA